jgi:hypothetical protein
MIEPIINLSFTSGAEGGPFVFPAPGEDSGNGGDDGSVGDGDGDGESDDSLFG